MTISLLVSTVYLAVVSVALDEPFPVSQTQVGSSLVQAVVCQLTAISISYATHANHQGFIEFIRSPFLSSVLFFLDEQITLNMIIGVFILLLIRITFTQKRF
jgi:hypothetical protein